MLYKISYRISPLFCSTHTGGEFLLGKYVLDIFKAADAYSLYFLHYLLHGNEN